MSFVSVAVGIFVLAAATVLSVRRPDGWAELAPAGAPMGYAVDLRTDSGLSITATAPVAPLSLVGSDERRTGDPECLVADVTQWTETDRTVIQSRSRTRARTPASRSLDDTPVAGASPNGFSSQGPSLADAPLAIMAAKPRGRSAFTMLELVGVMAIMCILALALLPAVLRKMDDLERANEEKQLQTLAGALRSSVLATRVIPSTNIIVTNLANQLGWSVDEVRTNGRGVQRYFIVDPATAIGTNRTLPYTQTNIPAAGLPTTQPTNRFIILSSLRSSQATVAVDCATDAAHFQSAWESDEGIAPTSATTGWPTADWGDVLIQRVDLRTIFTQVILNSSPGTNGEFSLDNTNNHLTLPRVPFSTYLLQGTKLGLHTNGGALQMMQIVQGAGGVTNRAPFFPGPSFVFERGTWRGKLFLTTAGQQRNGLDLQGAWEIFMAGSVRPDPTLKYGGVTPSTITGNFYNFMSNYVNWAAANFPATGTKTAVSNSFKAIRSDLSYYCK